MDCSKLLYTGTDTAKIIAAASGRCCPLSMLSYYITEGMVVPRQGHKNKSNYYEFYQVVWLYVLRYLKEYGIPGVRIKEVSTRRFMTLLRDYCNGKIGSLPRGYLICSETQILLDDPICYLADDPTNTREFFWSLPLMLFKEDIEKAIAELVKSETIRPVEK